MSRCGLCRHPDSNQLDALYLSNTPLRAIVAAANANPTGPHVSLGQAHRHKQHVKDLIRERLPAARQEHACHLLERVEKLIGEAEGVLVCAKSSQDWKGATAAIGAATRLLELLGRVSGELVPQNAPGLHLSIVNNKTTNVMHVGDDLEISLLISEATNGFDSATIERFRALAAGQTDTETNTSRQSPQ
jgi:hypothetical protein